MSSQPTAAPASVHEAGSPFFNRELSWLEFNARVLELARDEHVPPLERLRFLSIFSSNLDEFFMVRVAGLLDAAETDPGRRFHPGEPSVRELLDRVAARVSELTAAETALLEEQVLPSLAEHGVRLVGIGDLSRSERRELEAAFHRVIFPVLTPLAVGPGRPFPYISNLSLSLGVHVHDPETEARRFARVKVPEVLPRFWEIAPGSGRFLPLEDLIAANLGSLFPGMVIEEHATFRVTRDADFEINDEADDLIRAVEMELRRRRFGEVVRLELSADMSAAMREQLVHYLDPDPRHVYATGRLLDLADLVQVANLERPELHYPPWQGVTQPRLQAGPSGEPADVFAAIRDGDLLVHHPYDSFDTSVGRLIEQAVDDPNVLAIKHTIYRTSGDSPIVPGLIRAAEQGKQAVALVELKARFDEETNIGWARALERAGVHVVYGFADLKTHAKIALIVRREGSGIRRYAHIGTGNYNPKTARLYTDFGLLTARPDITTDVANLFNYLTGFARMSSYRKLFLAPLDLRERILEEIERVITAHDDGRPGRIVMKMNSLVDRAVIQALYRASTAGVSVDLVVRGICCLRPGLPGLSERVRVVSVLGRFLEHSRVFRFCDDDGERFYIGSADLMPRNLETRVEVVAPVEDEALQRELVAVLESALADNVGSFVLQPDGSWVRIRPQPGEPERSLQQEMLERALERSGGRPRDDGEDMAADEQDERVVRLMPRRPGTSA